MNTIASILKNNPTVTILAVVLIIEMIVLKSQDSIVLFVLYGIYSWFKNFVTD